MAQFVRERLQLHGMCLLTFFFLISWRILLWFVGLEGRGGKGVVSDPNHPGHPPEKRANATRSLVSVVRALFEFRLGN